MKVPEVVGLWSFRPSVTFRVGWGLFLALTATLAPIWADGAQPPINTESPIVFFTNVAGRLLQSELNLDLSRIQIYPTNQYTPVVHRLLQLTANIYDATTNRASTGYPFLPTVFRPLFRRDDAGQVFIVGYREVVDASLANPALAPVMVDLGLVNNISNIPPIGYPAAPTERLEPLVYGIPLIIGAKKGFPNFNEFSMQTFVCVSRLLEFRRDPSKPPETSPVIETNQMYVMAITNTFGLEAWNSYSNPYPRNLELITAVDMTEILTNELGIVVHSNRITRAATSIIAANTWRGWTNANRGQFESSFVLPFGSNANFTYLSNSTCTPSPPWFVPQTHTFERGQGFYVPQWFLNLHTQVRFILVDTEVTPNRIVDYVNLDKWERQVDLTWKLQEGAENCTSITQDTYKHPGNLWCTNRLRRSIDPTSPTFGVLNQIMVGLNGTTDWGSFAFDQVTGQDVNKAVDYFRWNLMGWSPLPEHHYNDPPTFYKSNVFYAPIDPYRQIFIYSPWQARDPLLHHTISHLVNFNTDETNRVYFMSRVPALSNLGQINDTYEPWGGSPFGWSNPDIPLFELAAKDPLVSRPDDWDFPSGEPLDVHWIGRVHRGTPWQSVFLKSTNILAVDLFHIADRYRAWQKWIGVSDPFQPAMMLPTNDWRQVSLLAQMFNAKHPLARPSVNQAGAAEWAALLDGMIALTNSAPFQLDQVSMSSNSPPVTSIAAALDAAHSSRFGGGFRSVGEIFAIPELSMSSPWLNPTNALIRDEGYEIIPGQLLSALRPDSLASVAEAGDTLSVHFTGYDGYAYAVQMSSDLRVWTTTSTNYPSNGAFTIIDAVTPGSPAKYYRSVLLP